MTLKCSQSQPTMFFFFFLFFRLGYSFPIVLSLLLFTHQLLVLLGGNSHLSTDHAIFQQCAASFRLIFCLTFSTSTLLGLMIAPQFKFTSVPYGIFSACFLQWKEGAMPSVVDFLWLLITYLAEMALAPSFVNQFSILKLHIRAKIHMHMF